MTPHRLTTNRDSRHAGWLLRFAARDVSTLDAEAFDLLRFEMLAWTPTATSAKRDLSLLPERIAPQLRQLWREKIGHVEAEDFMPPDVAVKAAVMRAIREREPNLYDRDASASVRQLHSAVKHTLARLLDGGMAWSPFTIGLGAKRQPDDTITREVMDNPNRAFYEEVIRVLVALGPRLRRCTGPKCLRPFAATRVDQRYCSPRCRTATYDRKDPLKRAQQKLDSRQRQQRAIEEVLGDAVSARQRRG